MQEFLCWYLDRNHPLRYSVAYSEYYTPLGFRLFLVPYDPDLAEHGCSCIEFRAKLSGHTRAGKIQNQPLRPAHPDAARLIQPAIFEGWPKRVLFALLLTIAFTTFLSGCRSSTRPGPAIQFTKLPEAIEGGPDRLETIEGKVTGARPGQKLVLFAKSGAWWVQPLDTQPFTTIRPDSTFSTATHLGTEYGALLVENSYQPPATIDELPSVVGSVVAVARSSGTAPQESEPNFVNFSGYQWVVRKTPSDRGGETTNYDPNNVIVDGSGYLHLRIQGSPGNWKCAEIHLVRSLGYGSYQFTVRDTSQLDPSVVLGMFTWDDLGAEQNHREMDIEISRWGDATSKNAQYVIQPYYVPANVTRFMAPSGRLVHSFRWEPGQVTFRTLRGPGSSPGDSAVSDHVFTSGIPAPAGESVHMNLYYFGEKGRQMPNPSEVVIEKFEYLP